MTKDDIIRYWLDSSEDDFRAMNNLFENAHNVWALFVGNLSIEKLLNAYYAKVMGIDAPWIHNLLKIAELPNLELSYEQRIFLDEVTTFNTKARYPDYKKSFYRKADREFTENNIREITEFRQWLIQKIKS